tara:strand:- start:912 stop:1379 length:468 start_codon:yes stop_codon:yes gene_type:complete
MCFKKYKINVLSYNYVNPDNNDIRNLSIEKLKNEYFKKYYNICINEKIINNICENENYLYSKEIFNLVSKYKFREIKNNIKYNITINPIGKNKTDKEITSEIYNIYTCIFKILFKKKYKYYQEFLYEILYNCEETNQEEWIIFNIYVIIKYIVNI